MKIRREADYPPETIEALQETFDIEAGKIPAKRYHSSQELFDANISHLDAVKSRDYSGLERYFII